MYSRVDSPLSTPRPRRIQKSILELLAYHRVFARRINVGMIPNDKGGFRRSLMTGMSDIIGILPGGRFLAIEVKAEGKLSGATVEQAAFLERVKRDGGIAVVADDVATVAQALG
jgi:hypothetical protein